MSINVGALKVSIETEPDTHMLFTRRFHQGEARHFMDTATAKELYLHLPWLMSTIPHLRTRTDTPLGCHQILLIDRGVIGFVNTDPIFKSPTGTVFTMSCREFFGVAGALHTLMAVLCRDSIPPPSRKPPIPTTADVKIPNLEGG